MKFLDLFSGIGGFALGLERAGHEAVAFCEIDPYCRRVLKKHWPDVPVFGDIQGLTGKIITDTIHAGPSRARCKSQHQSEIIKSGNGYSEEGRIDLICGGFPCQDISVAGKGAGIGGGRSGPATSSWRTSQLCLDGDYQSFSETWPRSGTMRNGIAYQLPPLVPLTDGTDCGLWATPMPSGVDGGRTTKGRHRQNETGLRRQVMWPTPRREDSEQTGGHRGKPDTLTAAARLWPTPTARDRHTLAKASRGAGSLARGQEWVPSLVVAAHMYPTPTVQDASNNGGASQYERNSLPLNAVVGGSLNPTWVEWLMGFPLGWTDLDH